MLPSHSLPEATTSLTRAAQRMFVELAADAAFILSVDGAVEHANDGAKALLGVTREDLTGQSLISFASESCAAPLQNAINLAREGAPQVLSVQLISSGGEDVHLQSKIFLDPATRNLWLIGSDLSSVRHAERELRRRATHDVLTGLPNRDLLYDRIERQINESKRQKGIFATVAMDLDGFKKTNDALGHLAGDELLKEVAKRIKACLREEDTVSRTGGDEFVLLLADLSSTADAQLVCQRVMEAMLRPIQIQGQDVYVSSSLGIAMYPEHGSTLSELMQHADQAMYLSKHHGKNRLSFYQPELTVGSSTQLSLESSMHSAINNGEFLVHYQPVVDDTGALKGCEALLRWRQADGTFISPAEFIPVAESNGLITLLGEYVLRVAVEQLRRFDAAGLNNMYVSVNVSPRQLRHPDFERNLKKILRMSGIAPERLILEITESMLMSGQQRTQAMLRQIAATGVRFALDDFGTGYSCLAYLKTYPISALKVDRSFIIGVDTDDVSKAIVRAILNLAQALNLKTVIEGIETEAQAAALRGMNADYLQGYLFGRPMLPEALIEQFSKA